MTTITKKTQQKKNDKEITNNFEPKTPAMIIVEVNEAQQTESWHNYSHYIVFVGLMMTMVYA